VDMSGIQFLVVDSPEGKDYIADQLIGARYASENRFPMHQKASHDQTRQA
jgi:hypothetical protein